MVTISEFEEILHQGVVSRKKVIVKLSATWCGPCKRIRPAWEKLKDLYNLESKFIILELDVDESTELYTTLKRKRMVNGIPAFLLWEPRPRNEWYIHDNGICNGDPNIIKLWIQNIL